MVVLWVFENRAVLCSLGELEFDRWATLRLGDVEGAIGAGFDSQKFKRNSPTVCHGPRNRQHGASRWLDPVFFNLGFAHRALPPAGQPGEIRYRFLSLSRQTQTATQEDQQRNWFHGLPP